jgi:hypothetical protein
MDNDKVHTCVICGGTPCEWEEFGGGVVEQSKLLYNREQCGEQDVRVDDNGVIVPNSRMRKALYRAFTYLKKKNSYSFMCYN